MKKRLFSVFAALFALCFPAQGTGIAFAAPETPVIPYCQHTWGAPEYTWSEDYSSCTARSFCTKNQSHKTQENADSECLGEEEATCETPAQTTYQVSFKNTLFGEKTVTVETGEPLGHIWGEPEYTWSEDLSTCTASRVCARDPSHVVEETVSTTPVVTRVVTAREDGIMTYSAVFTKEELPAVSREETVSRFTVLWGDANGDGVINNKDVVRLKNYFANFDDEIGASTVDIFPGADANGDGAFSNKDIVRLKNYLANYDDETGKSTVILGPEELQLELVAENASRYVIVYSASLDDDDAALINNNIAPDTVDPDVKVAREIRDQVLDMTGVELPLVRDDTAPAAYEILVGDTNRAESRAFADGLSGNEYGYAVIGEKIAVNSGTLTYLPAAGDAFQNLLQSGADGEDLVLPAAAGAVVSTEGWYTAYPAFSAGDKCGSFDCGDSNLLTLYENVSADDVTAYRTALIEDGFSFCAETELAGNLSFTALKAGNMVHGLYHPATGVFKIISAPAGKTMLPPFFSAGEPAPDEQVATPRITQLFTQYISASAPGMGYIITLSDGSFVVIDGGGYSQDTAQCVDDLMNALCALNQRKDGQVIIAGWIITHEHWDHVTAFYQLLTKYGSQITLEGIYANLPARSAVTNSANPNYYMESYFPQINAAVGGTEIYKIHTGMSFFIRDARFDVLFTQEDVYPERCHMFNETSCVLKMTLADTTVLWTGDAHARAEEQLLSCYGDFCACDIMQVAHHGYVGLSQAFYEANPARLLLWPTTQAEVDLFKTGAFVSWGVTLTVDKYLYDTYSDGRLLTAEHSASIALPYIQGDPFLPLLSTRAALEALPVASSHMEEDELRSIVVDFYTLQKSVPWISREPVRYTYGKDFDLSAGQIYCGLPYSGAGSSLYQFLDFYDEMTGVFTNPYGEDIGEYLGNHCCTSVYWAWARVSTTISFKSTNLMTAAHGVLPVGDYEIDTTVENFSNSAHYHTGAVCEANGTDVMYASYARLKPGDAVVAYNNSVDTLVHHARLVRNVEVKYNASGSINPLTSYVWFLEQDSAARAYTLESGQSAKEIGYTGRKVNFKTLYSGYFIPITCKELAGEAPVQTAEASLDVSPDETLTLSSLAIKKLNSNYCVAKITLTATDDFGNTVASVFVHTEDNTTWYPMATPAKRLSNALTPGEYTVTADVLLANGETVNAATFPYRET